MTGENVRARALIILTFAQVGTACGSHYLRQLQSPTVDGRSSTGDSSNTLGQDQKPNGGNGSNQTVDVDGKPNNGNSKGSGSDNEGTTVSTPVGSIVVTPISPATSTSPCSPKGGPLVGLSLVFDPVIGGELVINGDGADNVMEITGGGGPGVIRVFNADSSNAMIIPCVSDITINGGTGNDTIRIGDGFPGIGNLSVNGGPGANNITLFGNISATGSIIIN